MQKPILNNTKRGVLCCVIGAVCWGFSGTCGELLFREYTLDTSWLTAVRMTAAGVMLLLYMLTVRRVNIIKPLSTPKSALRIFLFATAGLALCQYSYLAAIRYTDSGTATVLQNLSIVIVAVCVCVFERKPLNPRTLFCIALATVGVWLVATGGSFESMKMTPQGLFWGIISAVGVATYSLLSRKPVAEWGSMPVSGLGMFIGGALLFVVVGGWNIPAGLDARAWLLIFIITALGAVAAYTLFLRGISLIGPVRATLIGCIEPLTAALLSAFWLGTGFSLADITGFIMILATVFIIR